MQLVHSQVSELMHHQCPACSNVKKIREWTQTLEREIPSSTSSLREATMTGRGGRTAEGRWAPTDQKWPRRWCITAKPLKNHTDIAPTLKIIRRLLSAPVSSIESLELYLYREVYYVLIYLPSNYLQSNWKIFPLSESTWATKKMSANEIPGEVLANKL